MSPGNSHLRRLIDVPFCCLEVSQTAGRMVYLWRAVDTEGEVLDVLVQSKLDKHAALKLMRKLLKKYGFVLDRMITDDLRSYGVAARALGIDRRHERGQWRSNRNRSLDDAAVETPSIALGRRMERSRDVAPTDLDGQLLTLSEIA
jgi:hypothetical protein